MSTTTIDTTHSEISFAVRHMMFAKVRGHFKAWKAELAFDAEAPSRSKVTVDVDVTSIDTREAKRDAHLRSADFFDAEQFPTMRFESTSVEATGEGTYRLSGDLTIRGTTRPVTLDVEQTGSGKDPWGNDRLGFTVKGSISRSEWGLTWNQALEAGGVLVGDKVEIEVETQVVASAQRAA